MQFRTNHSHHLGQQIKEKTAVYKRLLKHKANSFKQMLQGKLHDSANKSPQEWWALLRDLRSNAKWEDPDQHASIEDRTNFFQNLYNNQEEDKSNTEEDVFSSSQYFSNHPPTQEQNDLPIVSEITLGIKNLKSGKATGLDNISNEMLKVAGPMCQSLFNKIYSMTHFPMPWKAAYITTLHKKGPKQDPANYRPISITSCFGKLFTSILNARLMQYMQESIISHPFQGAFTKGWRGTDHIFVANTLIHQAKHLNLPLYAAFIDLQKAYDCQSSPIIPQNGHVWARTPLLPTD